MVADVAFGASVVVWEDVVFCEAAGGGEDASSVASRTFPGLFHVCFEVAREVGGCFFDFVDEVGVVAHVVFADGEEAGELVGEELASYVEAADGGLEGAAAEEGGYGSVGVARVYYHYNFRWEEGRCGVSGGAVEDGWNVVVCV